MKSGLYITWELGGEATEARDATATAVKAVGGHIVVSSAHTKTRVGHLNNMSPRWFVEINMPVGRKGAVDHWVEVDDEDVSTFRQAMQLAKRIARRPAALSKPMRAR